MSEYIYLINPWIYCPTEITPIESGPDSAFLHTGGDATFGVVRIRSEAEYRLTGGSLTIGRHRNEGTIVKRLGLDSTTRPRGRPKKLTSTSERDLTLLFPLTLRPHPGGYTKTRFNPIRQENRSFPMLARTAIRLLPHPLPPGRLAF